MQERRVTLDGTAHPLPPHFMVVATQNPIESQGVYPLPEAQLDRFLFKLLVDYPRRGRGADRGALWRRAAGLHPAQMGVVAVADAPRWPPPRPRLRR
jgi:MoxR-like ATPase